MFRYKNVEGFSMKRAIDSAEVFVAKMLEKAEGVVERMDCETGREARWHHLEERNDLQWQLAAIRRERK
jgi:hypothetical protein